MTKMKTTMMTVSGNIFKMSLNLDNLEIVYKKYYEISVQIAELIERELYDELASFIRQKEQILKEASILIDKIKETGEDASCLKELCEKIQTQEKENIKDLSRIKNEIKEELKITTKTKKLISAYSSSDLKNGSILDFSE